MATLFDNTHYESLLLEPLSKLLELRFSSEERDIFITSLKKLIDVSSLETRKQLYPLIQEKMKEDLLVAIEENVPQQILPPHLSLSIKDVKVKCRGPDDRIYARNQDLQQYIPRGLSLLFRKSQASEPGQDDELVDVVIFANRKFTGCIGDEDEMQPDSDDEWKKTFLALPESADFIVSTEKINGEAAHFGGRFIDGQFYIITGSKNVHIMIRNKEDISLYAGSRYCTANVVAAVVCRVLDSLPPSSLAILQQFLHFTRATLVCELLQKAYQHIVCLDHLESDQLKVFAMYCAPQSMEAASTSLTAMPVHLMLQFFHALGLDTPGYELLQDVTESTVSGHRFKVRGERDTEGRVMYYLQRQNLRTIGMTKLKSVWYVIVRAIREKAIYGLYRMEREPEKYTMTDLKNSTEKRLNEIQRWLKFSDRCCKEWKVLAVGFLTWINKRREESPSGSVRDMALRPSFPKTWNEFLSEQPLPRDNIDLYN